MKGSTKKARKIMEFQNLIKLIESVSASKLTELQYEENDVKIKLSKKEGKVTVAAPAMAAAMSQAVTPAMAPVVAPAVAPAEAAAENAASETVVEEGNVITSPLVGTFYAAPAEDAEAFVKVGDTVKKGQTLAIVEAMKLMNEIESDFDGTVKEVLVENGAPVEYGQPLFRIG